MRDLYIDIGSTNIKYSLDFKRINKIPFPAPCVDKDLYYEVKVEHILNIIKKIIDKNNVAERIFISVQMHGYVLLKGGKEVTNYISWRDERGKDVVPNFKITDEYGVKLKNNLPRLSILAQKVRFDEFCTMGSYIVYKLTGNNTTHITDFAPSGFYNVREKCSDKVDFKLPYVVNEVEIVGEFKNKCVYSPVGDLQASILGAVDKNYDGYILNIGTASQLCTINNDFICGDYESRPYFDGKTLCTVTGLIGGKQIINFSDEEIEDKLFNDWSNAILKLPKRNKIMVTGGVVEYRSELVEKVLKRMGCSFQFNKMCDSIHGLELLKKGLHI